MRGWWLAVALASGSVAVAAEAQGAAQKLTLAQALRPDIGGVQPTAVRLSPDGATLTLLRRSADDPQRFDLWAIDTRSGAERLLVDSKKIGSGAELSEAEKMARERKRIGGSKGIVAYDWAPDGRSLLVPLDGDLYRVSLDGSAQKLAGIPNGVLNGAISPKGGYATFLRDQNLWAMPLAGGPPHAVTTGGGGTVHFGEAEFVAQEEMARFAGYWWSPDDRLIAVERYDDAPVHVFTRAAIGASGTKTFEQRYPAAGTPNVLVSLYVMRPDGSGSIKVDLGSNPDIYLARVNWTPDGKALLVQRQSRDQQTLDLLRVDPATGASTVVFTERSGPKSWINLSDDLRALKDGSLIWSSERSGFRHLYHFKNGRWTQLTSGSWPVLKVIGLDEPHGRLFFTGLKDDPLEAQVYAVDIAHPGKITRLSERGYVNGGSMDEAATRLIVTRSSAGQPPQSYLADATGTRLRWISENRLAPGHPYYPFVAQHQPTRFGTVRAADGTPLYWEMITPPLEPGKRYPVFFEHYGGPTSQVVTKAWGGVLHQYLVSRGWIVFEIDNRGSPNRGKAFEDQIFHAMGTVEVADQKAGADYLRTLPFVDGDRIATYGWSYGGYMSLKMLEKTPGTYAAAVAGAPVTDWQLYDTHYTERYLGDPKTDPASYSSSAAWDQAKTIKDPLLIVHGMSDDNVFLDNSLKAIAEMQKNDVPFEMMLYPGYTHRVGGPGIGEHLWTTILDFLDRHVKDKAAAQ